MLGALTGDIIGSIYEFSNINDTDFPLFSAGCRFTDDSVLTVALAEAIITNGCYGTLMKEYYLRYPDCGYGHRFRAWARGDLTGPYNSYGNGAAMRISPVAWTCNTFDDVLKASRNYTIITHNHREGIKGAQATAAAIYLARTGVSKEEIRRYIEQNFSYDLSKTCDQIRPTYRFDESCQGTVPPAITAFLESRDFESSIRLAISLGGDSDTLACITGSIAEAYYGGVPDWIAKQTLELLDDKLRAVVRKMDQRIRMSGLCGIVP